MLTIPVRKHELEQPNENLGHNAVESPVVNWKTNRLQLVSLLMHDAPVVYETDRLPDMEKLSSETAETRPLSSFERDGLTALRSGKQSQIQATRNRIVMLGAIRAGHSCLECHNVKQGDLLGAFSYELLRSPILTPSDNRNGLIKRKQAL
jgi:hypothetical protein